MATDHISTLRTGLACRCPRCGEGKLFAGFLVLGLALYVEIAYEPPIWLHLLMWLPLAVIVCLALLRPMKGLAVALQFAHKAEEGRLKK